jgi:hypothetical protein
MRHLAAGLPCCALLACARGGPTACRPPVFSQRAVFKEDGPLIETRRVLSLLYSLMAEGSFLGKVHPFRERLKIAGGGARGNK